MGRFIVLEGPDGAGKSLQTTRLADALRADGQPVMVTREPGGTPLGESIRRTLLAPDIGVRSAISDALLFNAARAQGVHDVILPALARTETVVSDRFAPSTLAYQGYGSGLSLDVLDELERLATSGLRPDLVLLLDLPVEVGLARRALGARDQITRFEQAATHDLAFHERVRRGYLDLAAADPIHWRVIDASRGPDEVAEDIRRAVRVIPASSEPHGELLRIHP